MARERPFTNWDDVPVVFDLALGARILAIAPETLKKYCADGKFPAHKVFNSWRIDKAEMQQYLREH